MSARDCERSITSMRLMAELGAAHGLSVRACLAGTGVRERDLEDAAALVAPEQELGLIRNLVTHLGPVPALGIEAGLRYHFTAFGMLGLAMAASPDARGALEIALRYFNLTFAFTDFQVAETADETCVTLDDRFVPPDLRRFIVERDVAALVCVQRDLCPEFPILRDIDFALPPPGNERRYEALLGLRPSFGAARSVIRLNSAALRRPLPQANAIARKAAEDRCRLLLDRRRARSGLALRIRERLLRENAGMPDMETVARDLCMTPRTLRRRLDGEGTTFSTIRDEVRLALAEELLSMTELSIAEISNRLGYADPTSFTNAFKGWKDGATPLAWRKQAESGAAAATPPERKTAETA